MGQADFNRTIWIVSVKMERERVGINKFPAQKSWDGCVIGVSLTDSSKDDIVVYTTTLQTYLLQWLSISTIVLFQAEKPHS